MIEEDFDLDRFVETSYSFCAQNLSRLFSAKRTQKSWNNALCVFFFCLQAKYIAILKREKEEGDKLQQEFKVS